MNGVLGVLLLLSFLATSLAMKRVLFLADEDMYQFSSEPKRPRRVATPQEQVEIIPSLPKIEDVTEEFCFHEPENFLDLTLGHFMERSGDGAEIFMSVYEGEILKLSLLLSRSLNFTDFFYTSDKGKFWNLLEFAVALGSPDVCSFLLCGEFAEQVEFMKLAATELAYVTADETIRALFDVRLPIPKLIDHPEFNFGLEHEMGKIRRFLKTVDWSIHAQNEHGETALTFAIESQSPAYFLEYLLEAGFTADGQYEDGQTVFHKLVFWHRKLTTQKDLKLSSHDEKLVIPLIKMYPYLIDVPDHLGNTPLHYALKDRRLTGLCSTLIKAGATGEHTNLDGKWAIQLTSSLASASKARDEMEMLLSVKQMIAVFAGLFDEGSIFCMVPMEVVLEQIFPFFVQLRHDTKPASSNDAYVLLRCRDFPEDITKHIMHFVSSKTARKELNKFLDVETRLYDI